MQNTPSKKTTQEPGHKSEGTLRLFQAAVVMSLLLAAAGLVLWVASTRVSGTPYPMDALFVVPAGEKVATVEEAFTAFSNHSSKKRRYSASDQPVGQFWLALPLQATNADLDLVVELRMLRTRQLEFWGHYRSKDGRIVQIPVDARSEKGGTTVRLSVRAGDDVVIFGLIDPIGVARPKVFLWPEAKFKESDRLFERGGGALLGSFFMLAIFSAFVGLINRDWSFFLFSGWLITSLRVASINDGWDLYWLGLDLSHNSLLIFLRLSLAAHALLTIALFRTLLTAELSSLGLNQVFRIAVAVFTVVVLLGIILPHRLFLPVVWGTSAAGILLIVCVLCIVVVRTKTTVSRWYAASWGLTFLGIGTEVAYASGFVSTTLPGLNSQTAAIASALLTAVALAEKLRQERLERLAAKRETVQVLERFKDNYNSMPIGLFSIAGSGNLALFNPSFARMFGLQNQGFKGKDVHVDSVLSPGAFRQILLKASAVQAEDLELYSDTGSGARRWYLARVTKKDDAVEGSIQDITSRKAAEEQLKHLVDHDHLTGLLSRRGLEASIHETLGRVNEGESCAVAIIALDRFKLINDLHGHGTGDLLLQQTARRLKATVRARDSLARIADTFVVVLYDCIEGGAITERLREVICDRPFDIEGKGLTVTASVGVVSLDRLISFADVMAAADRACGEAKSRGRNRVVRLTEHDAALRTHVEELKVIANLQQQPPGGQYFLEFQPIVSFHTPLSSLSYEVLIRMRSEDGKVIPPLKFIGVAERNGLMSKIDRWVIRNTLEWLDEHPQHLERLDFATINISGASLNDSRFVDDAFAMIADYPLAMSKLCFEITESVALGDLGSTRRFVDGIRKYGSKLALDDFGAGYTSFSYLREIPADFIKIDGSLVREININPANFAITRMIVDLTHELGMSCIAEWAETEDTISSLVDIGVDYGQGFGLVRPTSPELVTAAASSGSLIQNPVILPLLSERSRAPTKPVKRTDAVRTTI